MYSCFEVSVLLVHDAVSMGVLFPFSIQRKGFIFRRSKFPSKTRQQVVSKRQELIAQCQDVISQNNGYLLHTAAQKLSSLIMGEGCTGFWWGNLR